jgi:plasmid stability protein
MRTTLAIDDDLLRRLKEKAAREGRTIQAVTNELLRQALASGPATNGYRLMLKGWKAEQQPGVDVLDRDKLFDGLERG